MQICQEIKSLRPTDEDVLNAIVTIFKDCYQCELLSLHDALDFSEAV